MRDDPKGITVILAQRLSGELVLIREHGDGRWWNWWRRTPVQRFASTQEAEAALRRWPLFFEHGTWWIVNL